MKYKRIVSITVLAILVTVFIGIIKHKMDSFFEPMIHYEEKMRITSPDGKVDVVLITQNGGAMSSVASVVYLVPKDKEVSEDCGTLVFHSSKAKGLVISWTEDRLLLIQYQEAIINQFQNTAYPFFHIDDYLYTVRIREIQIESQ